MLVKERQQFVNVKSGTRIKVTEVRRSLVNPRYDECVVYNTQWDGKVNKKTKRTILADSIRRRYYKI